MSLFKDQVKLGFQEAELETQKTLAGLPPLIRWLAIIFTIMIIPVYYSAKIISRKILTSRYSQGALYAKPSFTNPKKLIISNVNVVTTGSGSFAAGVKIKNPNLDLSLENLPFSFKFYNEKKQLVYTYEDKLFLLPDEEKYVTVPTFTAIENVSFANFEIPNELPWQKKLTIPKVQFSTSVPNSYQQSSPEAFIVEGDFTNDSPYTLKSVRLTFIIFGAQDKIVGISQRDEFTVSPFERRAYKQLWPLISAPDISRVEVRAETNTLNSNNLVINSSPSPASDLSRPRNKNR